MCCGNGGSGGARAPQTRQRSTPRVPGATGTWAVTLPDGEVLTGLTEHQALLATLKHGGGMEPERAVSTVSRS